MVEEPAKRRQKVAAERLYMASQYLSRETKKDLGLMLQVPMYVQDPEVARLRENLGIRNIDLDWEPGLADGPTSARVAVVDYNADTGLVAQPARWDEAGRRFLEADDPASFQFHQVNVWAVVQNTLSFFEDPHVMGRPIPWGFDGSRLIVVPHAGNLRNAYYDRSSKSLQLYYFGAAERPVYTCLSHDIISHETGHAVLDGIRPSYNTISSSQTAAFHEFLADLTAILSALRNNDVRGVVAEASGGDLYSDDTIADLAEQFARDEVVAVYGEAQRYYLRTAKNNLTMKEIQGEWEPHECSQVLTGAMFKILSEINKLQLADEPKPSPAEALWRATSHLNRMALRALDYCPPVDIQFIDYARAVLRADELAYPRDSKGYRTIIAQEFTRRGLEELATPAAPSRMDFLWKFTIDQIARSRTAAYSFLHDNRKAMHIPPQHDLTVTDLYYTDKLVEAEKCLPQEIVLEYVWEEDVKLEGPRFGGFQGQSIPLSCGGTLVFDGRGNVLHWSKKPGIEGAEGADKQEGEQRRELMLRYVEALIQAGMLGMAAGEGAAELALGTAAVVARPAQGRLRLEATPHLMHVGMGKGGHDA
jgi:hypothetical protein